MYASFGGRELFPILTIQNYVRPATLQEAWELNQKKANRVIGGMLWLRMGSGSVSTVIDLSGLGLNTIEETEDAFLIGAMVTQRQLEQHEGLNALTCGVMRKCVEHIVGVQFRNMATVGGSLWMRAGFSDVLTAFLALDTQVELYKGGIVPLADFIARKPDRDLLVRVIVRKHAYQAAYQSVRVNKTDFPALTCAAAAFDGQCRVCVGARPMRAMLVPGADALAGGFTAQEAHAFARQAAQCVPTGANSRGSSAYRTRLVRVLTERTLMEMGGLGHAD